MFKSNLVIEQTLKLKDTHQEKISICQNNYVVDVDKTKNKCGDQIIVDVVKTKNRSSVRSSYCLPILPGKHSRHLRLENAVFDLNTEIHLFHSLLMRRNKKLMVA